jgi:hypothetical protein
LTGNALLRCPVQVDKQGLLEISGDQFSSPLGEPMSHVSDHAWIYAVLGERGVSDLS